MEKEKTFSELLHGDMRNLKLQETGRKGRGKTVLVIDTEEPRVHYLDQSHYDTHDYLVRMMNASYGKGKGWYAKREMVTRLKVERQINAASPALAAEQRHAEPAPRKFKTAIALMNFRAKHREALKRQMHMYWGSYYGRGGGLWEREGN